MSRRYVDIACHMDSLSLIAHTHREREREREIHFQILKAYPIRSCPEIEEKGILTGPFLAGVLDGKRNEKRRRRDNVRR